MEIIKQGKAFTSAKETYKYTRGGNLINMRNAVGQELDVENYILFMNDDKEVLTVITADGDGYVTNSKSFITEFTAIASLCEDSNEAFTIEVIKKQSKGGRDFLICGIV